MDAAAFIDAGVEEAREDVVFVGRQHQPRDGRAHVHGDESGEDVAEIAGRHRDLDCRAVAAALLDPEGAPEVVDDLGEDPRPVD